MNAKTDGRPGTATMMRPARLVLVEDHPDVREHLTNVLEAEGVEVTAAVGDLSGGYDAVRSNRPDIVVVDNRLPDGRGVDLCEILAREFPDAALIVHSGAVTEGESCRALALGVRAIVPKSLRGRDLLDAVRDAVGRISP